MKKIYVCSPLSGDIENNIKKAVTYCRELVLFGCIPIAPHVYFTQFLNDEVPAQRKLGMECALELLDICDELHIYGATRSPGMLREIAYFAQIYPNRKIVEVK